MSPAAHPDDAPVLRVRGLGIRRGGRWIVDGADLTVPPGAVCALIGPNGAGKSTLLHVLAAAETAVHGEVTLFGEPISELGRRQRARRIALVEQLAESEVDLSVSEVVMLGRIPHVPLLGGPGDTDRAAVERALSSAGAQALRDRPFRELSGGERQRVLIARALAQEPVLLLLDEPTNHLDIAAQLELMRLLRSLAARGVAVLVALHDLTLAASWADTVVMMQDGRVVAVGPPATVVTPERLLRVYGVHAEVLHHPRTGRPVIAYEPLDDGPGAGGPVS